MQGTQSKTESDFCLEDHGSILLLRPLSDAAEEWVDENIGEGNGFQWEAAGWVRPKGCDIPGGVPRMVV